MSIETTTSKPLPQWHRDLKERMEAIDSPKISVRLPRYFGPHSVSVDGNILCIEIPESECVTADEWRDLQSQIGISCEASDMTNDLFLGLGLNRLRIGGVYDVQWRSDTNELSFRIRNGRREVMTVHEAFALVLLAYLR